MALEGGMQRERGAGDLQLSDDFLKMFGSLLRSCSHLCVNKQHSGSCKGLRWEAGKTFTIHGSPQKNSKGGWGRGRGEEYCRGTSKKVPLFSFVKEGMVRKDASHFRGFRSFFFLHNKCCQRVGVTRWLRRQSWEIPGSNLASAMNSGGASHNLSASKQHTVRTGGMNIWSCLGLRQTIRPSGSSVLCALTGIMYV